MKIPNNLRPLINPSNEDDLPLGDEKQGACILNSIRTMEDKSEVIEVCYEATSEKCHLWLATYSQESKKNRIVDLKNSTFDGIWDRE